MWSRPNARSGWFPALALLGSLLVSFNGCARNATAAKPTIEFSVIPLADAGGPDKEAPIAGRAVGFRPGQRIVLFAKAEKWWVQPTVDQPFTCLLYTSDAADERSSVDLGGRRIIKKKKKQR